MRVLFTLQAMFAAVLLVAVLFNAGCASVTSDPDGARRIAMEF